METDSVSNRSDKVPAIASSSEGLSLQPSTLLKFQLSFSTALNFLIEDAIGFRFTTSSSGIKKSKKFYGIKSINESMKRDKQSKMSKTQG